MKNTLLVDCACGCADPPLSTPAPSITVPGVGGTQIRASAQRHHTSTRPLTLPSRPIAPCDACNPLQLSVLRLWLVAKVGGMLAGCGNARPRPQRGSGRRYGGSTAQTLGPAKLCKRAAAERPAAAQPFLPSRYGHPPPSTREGSPRRGHGGINSRTEMCPTPGAGRPAPGRGFAVE